MREVDARVNTLIPDLAVILPRVLVETGISGNGVSLEENAGAKIVEIVNLNLYCPVEERKVEPGVYLVLYFPTESIVLELQVIDSSTETIGRSVCSDSLIERVSAFVERGPVEETARTRIVISGTSERGTDFSRAENIFETFRIPAFIGDYITGSDCREESETIFFRKSLAARISEVGLHKIAVVVAVCHTPYQSLFPIWQSDGGELLVLHIIEEHSTHIVFTGKDIIVLDGSFDVNVSGIITSRVGYLLHIGRPRDNLTENQFSGFRISSGSVIF